MGSWHLAVIAMIIAAFFGGFAFAFAGFIAAPSYVWLHEMPVTASLSLPIIAAVVFFFIGTDCRYT